MIRKIIGVMFTIIIALVISFPEWFAHTSPVSLLEMIALMIATAFTMDWK